MLLDVLLVLVGIALIIAGANFLTDGASSIASKFKISQMVIGLTVVAFGTSAPELTVSVLSGLEGNGGIAVGNVIGSNIFNVFAILGLTAIIIPLPVGKSSRNFDMPLCVLSSLLLILVIGDIFIDGKEVSELTRSEGWMLIAFGLLFLSYTIYMGKKGSQRSEEHSVPEIKDLRPVVAALYVIGGLAALIFGGRLFVNSASEIARSLGVGETLIGLTLVSWGTSMPELATSLVAAIKKNADIAIGNVVGSNIFNILFVLGITGAVNNQTGLNFSYVDLFMQFFAPFALLFFSRFISIGKINRVEGALLLLIFAAYTWYLISTELAVA